MRRSALARYQECFADAVLQPTQPSADLDWIRPGAAVSPARRLSVYRNNVMHSLSRALGDLYPVVKRLLGAECFQTVAVEFVRRHPPREPALVHYGRAFPTFLSHATPCRDLLYLGDVARLEWCCHRAFHAADEGTLAAQDLSAVAQSELGAIRLQIHPSIRPLQSRWPVDRIWEENLKHTVGTLDLSTPQPCFLLVYRDALQVKVLATTRECWQFFQALATGHCIARAWQSVDAHTEPDALAPLLGFLLSHPLFSGFEIHSMQE